MLNPVPEEGTGGGVGAVVGGCAVKVNGLEGVEGPAPKPAKLANFGRGDASLSGPAVAGVSADAKPLNEVALAVDPAKARLGRPRICLVASADSSAFWKPWVGWATSWTSSPPSSSRLSLVS